MGCLIGFVAGMFFAICGGSVLIAVLLNLCPSLWVWGLGFPILGYWLGQAPRNQTEAGLACGFILVPLALYIPEIAYLARRIAYPGVCDTGLRQAWFEATALLVCISGALGQLRYFLRRRPVSRWPDD